MRNNLIIYTEYYMEGVIEVVESTRLDFNILAVGTRTECLAEIKTTPNLLGVVLIEHIATTKVASFYKDLMHTLDNIAYSLQRPLVLSLMYRSKHFLRFIQQVKTKYITISVVKFDRLNEEMIRLDGIVPVLVPTLGVFKTQPIKYFEVDATTQNVQNRNALIDALIYMLGYNLNDNILHQYFKRHPELRKMYSLKTSDEFQEECFKMYNHSLFGIFCEMLVEQRCLKS